MTNTQCPYLTNWNAQGQPVQPITYPSFENHCFGHDDNSSLLLTDQATFCLSGSHRLCPLHAALAAQQVEPPSVQWTRQRARPAEQSSQTHPFIPLEQPGQSPAWGRAINRDADVPTESGSEDWAGTDPQLDWLPNEALMNEPMAQDETTEELAPTARWWAWAGATLVFTAVVGMGSLFAAWAGWQMALEQLATARAGQIDTLPSTEIAQVQPLYLVMTTTREPATEAPAANALALQPRTGQANKGEPVTTPAQPPAQNDSAGPFPAAVTPTPVVVVPLPSDTRQNAEQAPATGSQSQLPPTATPASLQLPPPTVVATAVPLIDVQVAVPTRRPTPQFDIPTSTPEPLAPTATATQVPILGTPSIVFAPDESAVPPGKCTHVRWRVENVREVYYENLPAFGTGEHRECLEEERDTFALTVIFGDGQTKIYTTAVDIVWPTPTPSITPSFTPEIAPTETWTPEPPTATPTPAVLYGTTLSVNGANSVDCAAGTTCSIDLLATNTGDSIDTLAIEIVSMGSWSAMLCSQMGTCGTPRLVVANVGPANTVFVSFQITIPADVAGQNTSYTLRAVSEGSTGAVASQVVGVDVNINE